MGLGVFAGPILVLPAVRSRPRLDDWFVALAIAALLGSMIGPGRSVELRLSPPNRNLETGARLRSGLERGDFVWLPAKIKDFKSR
jgi:hypothetical protein